MDVVLPAHLLGSDAWELVWDSAWDTPQAPDVPDADAGLPPQERAVWPPQEVLPPELAFVQAVTGQLPQVTADQLAAARVDVDAKSRSGASFTGFKLTNPGLVTTTPIVSAVLTEEPLELCLMDEQPSDRAVEPVETPGDGPQTSSLSIVTTGVVDDKVIADSIAASQDRKTHLVELSMQVFVARRAGVPATA
jgi:hypothetical protein